MTKRGPSVETFIRAIEGLGLPVWEFFARLEPPALSPAEMQRHLDNLQILALRDPRLARAIVRSTEASARRCHEEIISSTVPSDTVNRHTREENAREP
jgi:hypothetical protein